MALPGAGNLQDDNSGGDNSAASERLGQGVSEPSGAADPLLEAYKTASKILPIEYC